MIQYIPQCSAAVVVAEKQQKVVEVAAVVAVCCGEEYCSVEISSVLWRGGTTIALSPTFMP